MENIKPENFKNLENEIVVLDFYADWCNPCKGLLKVLEGLEEEYPNAKFVKMSVDEEPEYASEMGVRGLPTVFFYKNGVQVSQITGFSPPDKYKETLNSL